MPGSLPRLIVRDVSGGQHEVEISRTPFSMGRIRDNDRVLLDGRVSRNHARIIQGEHGYLIEDTESRHGTYLNGERITSSLLKPGFFNNTAASEIYTLCFDVEQAELPSLLEK